MTARNPASAEGAGTLSLPARLIRDESPRDRGVSQTQLRFWWRAMEQAITLGILLVIAWSVADSIWAAGWVDDMPDLRLVALLALVSAGVMSSTRVHWTVGVAAGLAVGVVVVLWQVLTVDTVAGQPFFWDRFTDLWGAVGGLVPAGVQFRNHDGQFAIRAVCDGGGVVGDVPRRVLGSTASQSVADAAVFGHHFGGQRELSARQAVGLQLCGVYGWRGAVDYADDATGPDGGVAPSGHAVPRLHQLEFLGGDVRGDCATAGRVVGDAAARSVGGGVEFLGRCDEPVR